MPGFKLFTSNRLEVLLDLLGEILRTPLGSPLDKEIIVVQSKGMERWVSMELARCHGVCANISFPFPNAFVDEVLRKVVGDFPEPSPMEPSIMTWRVLRLLSACVGRPGFEVLRKYLEGDIGQLKQFQLAQRIANLFDQYLVFRPEMLMAWENGSQQSGDWQSLLWQELVRESLVPHRAALRIRFFETLRQVTSPPLGLPQRLAIFGISALPPFHMEVFSELARFVPVHLFLMNPCKEYWGDIRSEREMGRMTLNRGGLSLGPEDLYLEQGNSLLASMGSLGRDFFHLVQDHVGDEEDWFQEPGENHLLACIQRDILHLEDRAPQDKQVIAGGDRSVSIHSCHSPMREVEVLYDQLLALFEEEPDLGPKDVLVMTPAIDVYAPFIHAVFDAPENAAWKIPFSITDGSLRKESQMAEAFLAMIDLANSRLGAGQVLKLLESKALRRKFDLTEGDTLLIHRWVEGTRIRWGADARMRTSLGFGGFGENSWRAGLDRLLLGYALPGDGERLFEAILPYDHIEGGDAVVLGKLVEFIERLFAGLTVLGHPHTLAEWAQILGNLLHSFFAPDSSLEKEAQLLREVLNDLGSKQETAEFAETVGIEVVGHFLRQHLERQMVSLGFITGGVTFCAMLPMRSIPFPVICLQGMDDGAFPRQSQSLGFDLMARTPRPGDRSQRSDDRYLFLEALISARRRLYISYVGQSLEDNAALPPSVLVSELLDVIDRGYALPKSADIVEHLTTRHRLQPFSPQYFKEDGQTKHFSYSEENCRAGLDARRQRVQPQLFIASQIDEPEEEWRSVSLDQLGAFFSHPAKFFLQKRLQVQLETTGSTVEDRESFDLDHLEQFLLAQKLLDGKIAGLDVRKMLPVVQASGGLPHGVVGQCRYDLLRSSVESFFAAAAPILQASPLPPLALDLELEPFVLTGSIQRITALGLVHYRNARIKARDHLNLWIRLLGMNACATSDSPRSGFLVGRDGTVRYDRVGSAREALTVLLHVYWEGLRRPLHFFPNASYQYAKKFAAGSSREDAIKAARREWGQGAYPDQRAVGQDPYLDLCFGDIDPIDDEFEHLALKILEPLLMHQLPHG